MRRILKQKTIYMIFKNRILVRKFYSVNQKEIRKRNEVLVAHERSLALSFCAGWRASKQEKQVSKKSKQAGKGPEWRQLKEPQCSVGQRQFQATRVCAKGVLMLWASD